MNVEKELMSFFCRCLVDKLSLTVIHTCFKVGDMFKHKERQPKLYRHNVVYKLTCSCGSTYIGQCKRSLRTRLNDHNPGTQPKTQLTDVTQHLFENP